MCVFGHHLAHGDAIEFARRRNDHIVRKARDDDVLKLELDGLEEWLAFDEVGDEGEVDGDEDGSCVEQGVRACESKRRAWGSARQEQGWQEREVWGGVG